MRPSGLAIHFQHGIDEEIDWTRGGQWLYHEVLPMTEFKASGRVMTHRKELVYGVACIQEDCAKKDTFQQPNPVLEDKMQGKIR